MLELEFFVAFTIIVSGSESSPNSPDLEYGESTIVVLDVTSSSAKESFSVFPKITPSTDINTPDVNLFFLKVIFAVSSLSLYLRFDTLAIFMV